MKSSSLMLGAIAIGAWSSVHAATLSVSDPFLQWYNVGPNDLSFTSGDLI